MSNIHDMTQVRRNVLTFQSGEEAERIIAQRIKTDESNAITGKLKIGEALSAAWELAGDPNSDLNGPNQKARYNKVLKRVSDKLSDTDLSQKEAYRLRKLWDHFGHLPVDTIRNLQISNCYMLSADDVTEEEREAIIAEARKRKLSAAQVKHLLESMRPDPDEEEEEDDPQPDPDPDQDEDEEDLPDPEEGGPLTFDPAPISELRDEHRPLYRVIYLAGRNGISQKDLRDGGHLSTIDKNGKPKDRTQEWTVPLFRRGLIFLRWNDGDPVYYSVEAVTEPIVPDDLPEKDKAKLERLTALQEKRFKTEVDAAATVKANDWNRETKLDRLQRDLDAVKKLFSAKNGLFTKADMKALKLCVHPDATPSAEVKATAFAAIERVSELLIIENDDKRDATASAMTSVLAKARQKRAY